MGLRCSLLGHAYGEPVTERERERRGDEEVVTLTKLRTCARCGAETVLSENTEVRHLDSEPDQQDQPPTGPEADQRPEDSPAPEPTPAASEPSPETVEPDTGDSTESNVSEFIETVDTSETTTAGSGSSDPTQSETSASSSDVEAGEPADQATGTSETDSEFETGADESDDGIIIDDVAESTSESGDESGTESPNPQGDSPAPAAEPLSGSGSIDDVEETAAEATNEPATDQRESTAGDKPNDVTDSTAESESMFGTASEESVDRETRATDSKSADQRDAWKERPPTEGRGPDDSGSTVDQTAEGRADPAFQFESPDDDADRGSSGSKRGPAGIASEGPIEVDVEAASAYDTLVCPECGFRQAAVSSLRAGDICPECHRGYLAGRR